jgi:hypothetical protein
MMKQFEEKSMLRPCSATMPLICISNQQKQNKQQYVKTKRKKKNQCPPRSISRQLNVFQKLRYCHCSIGKIQQFRTANHRYYSKPIQFEA